MIKLARNDKCDADASVLYALDKGIVESTFS